MEFRQYFSECVFLWAEKGDTSVKVEFGILH